MMQNLSKVELHIGGVKLGLAGATLTGKLR